jgi:hypothetical protein
VQALKGTPVFIDRGACDSSGRAAAAGGGQTVYAVLIDVGGHVSAVENRSVEVRQREVSGPDAALQLLEVLIDKPVGTDLPLDFRFAAPAGDQLCGERHVNAVDIGMRHKGHD